jgi:disulfide bond formation protein DsbB
MAIALVIVLAFFGLGFLLVWRIAAGNNWARIILLILVLFGTPLAVPGYLAALKLSVVSGSISIFINILQLIGTYLLFTRGSNVWFRNRK